MYTPPEILPICTFKKTFFQSFLKKINSKKFFKFKKFIIFKYYYFIFNVINNTL